MAERTLDVTIVPVTGFQQNCSIISELATKRAVVVDPGGDVPRILAAIKERGVTVERIWLTHGHIDHAGGAAELKDALGGVPIEGPGISDKFLLDGLPGKALEYNMAGVRAVTPDRWLSEGETLTLSGLSFSILHVPGHTPGSLVFYNDANKFALVGDTLFRGSIGRTDMDYGDHAALVSAIRNKLLPLGDGVTFLPGHGPHGTLGAERQSNPYVGDSAA